MRNINKSMSISIIIPTRNEAKNIGRCLKSIVENGYGNFEIIVVDQDSTDNTRDIVKNYKAKLVKVRATDKYIPPSKSRNLGFKYSKGDIIYNLDADMELQKGLLAEISSLLSLPNTSAVVIPEIDIPSNFWAKGKAFERSLYYNTVMEAARASKRNIFSKILYDKNISSGEDWNIHYRFSNFGVIKRSSKIVKHHIGSISLKREFIKKLHYGSESKNYLHQQPSELKNRFLKLILMYSKGIFGNICISPASVLAFIIVRIIDTCALTVGYIFYSKQ